jgi:hypothetical protein
MQDHKSGNDDNGCEQGTCLPRTGRSDTRACALAKTVVGAQNPRGDTINTDERDAIEHDLPDLGDVTLDVIGAPLGWTMAPVFVAVELGETACRAGVFCLDADRLRPRSDGHHRYVEVRQRGDLHQNPGERPLAASPATSAADRAVVARSANRRDVRGELSVPRPRLGWYFPRSPDNAADGAEPVLEPSILQT